MAIRVVLQSRLTSSRLPAKAMLTVAGMPMVVLAALRAARTGLDVVVATSDHEEDDLVANAASHAGLKVARGPLEDPLARFALATQDLDPTDVVVRLTADNVFPDGSFAQLLAEAVSDATPYVRAGGDLDSDLPYGVSGEAFLARDLRLADLAATEPFDREHVTPWIRANRGDTCMSTDAYRPSWRGLRCTIDTFDDYVRVADLFGSVNDPVHAPWEELADLLAARENGAQPIARTPRASGKAQSRLILGTVQLGISYGAANLHGLPSSSAARDILVEAARVGISHLDTARAYGLSESRIGDAFQRGLSEHLSVVTKLRPLHDVPADSDSAWGATAARGSLMESLVALRARSIDTLLTHRAEDWFKPGVRAALIDAKDEGFTAAIGVSLSTPQELVRVLADPEIEYVQFPFNMADDRWLASHVQKSIAARPDVLLTARSAFLQGLLVADESAHWPGNVGITRAEVARITATLTAQLGRRSRTDLALAYVLAQPWITSVVVGAETADQVAELAELAHAEPFTVREMETVRAAFAGMSPQLIDPSTWEMH